MHENISFIAYDTLSEKMYQTCKKTNEETLKNIIDVSDTEEPTSETTEQTTQDLDVEYITTEGQVVDTRLYLSVPVNNADLNDVYSMLLSIRNLFVLFILIFVFFKVKTSIHSIFAKIFNVEK